MLPLAELASMAGNGVGVQQVELKIPSDCCNQSDDKVHTLFGTHVGPSQGFSATISLRLTRLQPDAMRHPCKEGSASSCASAACPSASATAAQPAPPTTTPLPSSSSAPPQPSQ